ncbi:MAG: orotate phosphoribosyltransferase [Thermoprotei archaeon]|nr:MAG: orotate phosphoribosyltransferase [Thermoprotei archaeon]
MNVVDVLKRIGAVQTGEFILSSGRKSRVYVDLRKLPSHPRAFKEITRAVARLASRLDFDFICGIAVGGLPLATVVAYEMEKKLIYVRKERKGHGTGKIIEGDFEPGARVLVLDDVATTGSSILRAVRVLRSVGLIVEESLVVVDRLEGAREALREAGVKLYSLITLKDLLEGCENGV